MKRIFYALIFFAAIFTASCEKAKNESKSNSKELKLLSAKYEFSDFPTLEDGMLVFRDAEHFHSYISFLERAMGNIDPDDTTKDQNDVLLEIEQGLKFTSIRNISHAAFMQQNETGWATIEEIPDEHFIISSDLRSVLNSNLDVRIGGEVVHFINKDYLVRVDATETELLNKFRGLSTNATFDDIRSLDFAQEHTTIQLLTDVGFVWEKRKKPTPTPTGDWDLSTPWTGFRDPCNNPRLLSIRNIALYDGYLGIQNAKFVIDFGDASASDTKYAQPNEVPEFTHLYPSPGNYNIVIYAYATANSNTIVAQRTIPVTVLDGGCRNGEKNSGWYYTIVGNKAVSGNIYIHYTGGLFGGSFNTRMDATTRSMEYKDGQWKLVKAKIGLHSVCATKDGNCTQLGTLEATDEKNKKEFTEHRTWNGNFFWTTASCEHYIYINGTKHTLQVSMNSCP